MHAAEQERPSYRRVPLGPGGRHCGQGWWRGCGAHLHGSRAARPYCRGDAALLDSSLGRTGVGASLTCCAQGSRGAAQHSAASAARRCLRGRSWMPSLLAGLGVWDTVQCGTAPPPVRLSPTPSAPCWRGFVARPGVLAPPCRAGLLLPQWRGAGLRAARGRG
jgi:hypothetical protein